MYPLTDLQCHLFPPVSLCFAMPLPPAPGVSAHGGRERHDNRGEKLIKERERAAATVLALFAKNRLPRVRLAVSVRVNMSTADTAAQRLEKEREERKKRERGRREQAIESEPSPLLLSFKLSLSFKAHFTVCVSKQRIFSVWKRTLL